MIRLAGKPVAEAIGKEIDELLTLYEKRPCLAIVRVGERPEDIAYEKNAVKRMEKHGITVQSVVFPKDIGNAAFLESFRALNQNPDIDGILLMRPLPKQINSEEAEAFFDEKKDVDGITLKSLAGVFAGRKTFSPCTAEAVIRILDHYEIPVQGKKAVVIGRSLVIGKPVAMLLLQKNATVTICHSKTEDLASVTRTADILVTACGQAGLIDESFMTSGACVVDVSINVGEDGTLCGDCVYDKVSEKASALTPVPGGVGSVTTAVLALHTAQAFIKKCEENYG